MAKDATGREINLGDTVMLARTGKSSGISWSRVVVTRLSEKSFWHKGSDWLGGERESGPRRPENCIVVESA